MLIKRHLEARKQLQQKIVCTPLLPMAETENARGALAEIELLLALPNQTGPLLPPSSE
jgi:hypothetical protein